MMDPYSSIDNKRSIDGRKTRGQSVDRRKIDGTVLLWKEPFQSDSIRLNVTSYVQLSHIG